LAKVRGRLSRLRPITVGQMAAHWETDHLKRLLAYLAVDCVFDIGANEGQYANRLRSAMKFRGTILSFEPHPEMYFRLRAASADDPKWHVFPYALSDSPGTVQFNVTRSAQMGSLSTPTAAAQQVLPVHAQLVRTVDVEVRTLAEMYPALSAEHGFRRPFLKTDTQGFDVRVIRGVGDELHDFVGLQSELAVVRLYEEAPDYLSALRLYESLGFVLSALVPNNSGHFPRMLEVDCVMVRQDLT